jgi:hypothetical protein
MMTIRHTVFVRLSVLAASRNGWGITRLYEHDSVGAHDGSIGARIDRAHALLRGA